jgi:hypothetical protein
MEHEKTRKKEGKRKGPMVSSTKRGSQYFEKKKNTTTSKK